MNPWPFIALAFVVASFAAGWVKGNEHGTDKLTQYVGEQATETVRVARARDIVSVKVERKYLPAIERQHVITETIVREVNTYVPSTDPDLSPGFRELHDAAAEGRLPDPARKADGSPVPAQTAAESIVANYGACRKDQLTLQGLQEWVAAQQGVK